MIFASGSFRGWRMADPVRVLDLFSGIGGFAVAFEAAGAETVAFSEVSPGASIMLQRLWPDVPNLGDVRGIRGEDVVRRFGAVDVLCGGFPCQDISAAGKGAGIEGHRSGLWFEMLRLVRELRPAWVLAENVPALRTRGSDVVLAGLEEAGYTARAIVVGAWAVGAPHRRDRVWIVANRETSRWTDERHWRSEGSRTRCNGEVGVTRLADSERDRPQGAEHALDREGAPGVGRRLADARWPSRPGEAQHEWEEPRTVEPSVGCAVDGVSTELVRRVVELTSWDSSRAEAWAIRNKVRLENALRKEALKALGNSIVPQVAAPLARFIVEQIQNARCDDAA